MACVTNCSAATISRNYLFGTTWDIRHRTGFSGLNGVHGAQHSENFNSTFHNQLGLAFAGLNHWAVNYGPGTIDWIGDVGVQVCKAGCHSTGRAFDLTAIRLGATTYDMNVIWRADQSLANRRKYLAIWAAMRRDCTTVLTQLYNSDHNDHIHVDIDSDTTPPPIRTSATSDVKLIQHACNLLNGTALSVDGVWGTQTSNAYNSLLNNFRLSCYSPTTDYFHMRALVEMICQAAMANQNAGTYLGPCGPL